MSECIKVYFLEAFKLRWFPLFMLETKRKRVVYKINIKTFIIYSIKVWYRRQIHNRMLILLIPRLLCFGQWLRYWRIWRFWRMLATWFCTWSSICTCHLQNLLTMSPISWELLFFLLSLVVSYPMLSSPLIVSTW